PSSSSTSSLALHDALPICAPSLTFLSALSLAALVVRRNGFDLTGFALAPQTLDFEGIARFDQFSVTGQAISFRIGTGLSAVVTITSTHAVLFPGSTKFTAEATA